jgi:hypothetical protein
MPESNMSDWYTRTSIWVQIGSGNDVGDVGGVGGVGDHGCHHFC